MSNQHEENAMGGYEPEQEATHSLYDENTQPLESDSFYMFGRWRELQNGNVDLPHYESYKRGWIDREALISQPKVTEAELVTHCWDILEADSRYKVGGLDPVQATVEAILSRYTLVKKGV